MIRFGSPSLRAMAVAATASGGAITAPSTSATGGVSPGTTMYVTQPTASVAKSTYPTDSSAIGRALARRSRYELSTAAVCSSGGSSSGSTMCGSSVYAGSPGTYAATSPTATSSSGAGTGVLRASPATAALPATSATSGNTSMRFHPHSSPHPYAGHHERVHPCCRTAAPRARPACADLPRM